MRRELFIGLLFGLTSVGCAMDARGPAEDDAVSVEDALHGSGRAVILQIVAGYAHTCVLVHKGGTNRVKCWGANHNGELGLGDTNHRGDEPGEMGAALPYVDLGTGRSAKALAAAGGRTCAILDDDTLKCWGYSSASGALGLGDTDDRGDAPGEMGDQLPVVNLGTGRKAKKVATSSLATTCAILDNDDLKCWGVNSTFADGNEHGAIPNSMGDNLPRTNLGTGRHATSITIGDGSGAAGVFCAILDNGATKCWGDAMDGQLGTGDTVLRASPGDMGDNLPTVNLGTGRKAKRLSASTQHACAILDNDRLKCWGIGFEGRLGLGHPLNLGDEAGEMGNALPNVSLGAGLRPTIVTVADFHTCVRLDNGATKCWGANHSGTLGLEDNANRGDEPGEMGNNLASVDLGTGLEARLIAAGGMHTCAVIGRARVKCWGSGDGNGGGGGSGYGDSLARGSSPGEMGDNLPFVDLGL